MQTFLSQNHRLISKLIYGLTLCLSALILSRELSANGAYALLPTAAADEAKTQASDAKRVALTFDDGPHPVYTEQLLDGLKERGVQATFFLIGENAERYPDIVKRMYDEGHLIGNHTYSHIQLTSANREKFKEELVKTSKIIQDITGAEVQYVRPPYGSWDKSFESELNMFPILWNVDPRDWSVLNADKVAYSVVKSTGENSIILLHDCYESSVEAALMIIDELQSQGYEFVTVDKLIFD